VTKKNKNIDKDKRKLSILVSLYGLSFVLKDVETKTSKTFEYIFDALNPFQLERKLREIVEERPVLQKRFNSVRLIHHNNLNTLVPKDFFDKKHLKDYLKFNMRLLPNDYANYDDVSDLVNVYVPYVNINNVFLDYNKSVNYYHSSSIFIKKVNKIRRNTSFVKFYDVYLNVYPKDFQLLIFKDDEILLYNNFEAENTDDFLYYFFYALEQLKIDKEKTSFHIMGTTADAEIIENLKDFQKDWEIIPGKTNLKFNNFIL